MPPYRTDWDATSLAVAVVVFALPLTLLVPNFSVWDFVPKIHVTRYFAINQYVSWSELNAVIIVFLVLFFCIYLDIRKRKLDEMVDNVLTVSQATDVAMEVERGRQVAAIRACVELLDSSTEHYENLILFRDDLRKREKDKLQHPPVIEPSSSTM